MATSQSRTRAFTVPSFGTISVIAASITAVWLLVSSMFVGPNTKAELNSKDPTVRLQAVEKLIRLGREGVPELVRSLADPNLPRTAQLSILYGLRQIGSDASEARVVVKVLLTHQDELVRSAAIDALVRLADSSVTIPILMGMLDDFSNSVRKTAHAALDEIPPSEIPELAEILQSQSSQKRAFGFRFLRRNANTGVARPAIERVRRLGSHIDKGIRHASLFAVVVWGNLTKSNLATNAEIRTLLSAYTNELKRNPAVLKDAMEAVGNRGVDSIELLPDLIGLLDSFEPIRKQAGASGFEPGELNEYEYTPKSSPLIGTRIMQMPFTADFVPDYSGFLHILEALKSMGSESNSAIQSVVRRLWEISEYRIDLVRYLIVAGCDPEPIVEALVSDLTQLIGTALERYVSVEANRSIRFSEEVYTLSHSAELIIGDLIYQASRIRAREQVSALLLKLRNERGDLNRTVLCALHSLGAVAQDAVPAVLPLLSHPDPFIRHSSISIVISAAGETPEQAEFLTILLDERTGELEFDGCLVVITELGKIGAAAKAAIPVLKRIVADAKSFADSIDKSESMIDRNEVVSESDTVDQLRASAILSLGTIAEPTSNILEIIRLQLKSDSEYCRSAAVSALGSLTAYSEAISPEIYAMIMDEGDSVRRTAVFVLGRLSGDRQSRISTLERCLFDQDFSVRVEAVVALRSFGFDAKTSVPALKKLLKFEPLSTSIVGPGVNRLMDQIPIPPHFTDIQWMSFPEVIQQTIRTLEK